MERDILSGILEIEKEIDEKIEAEKAKSLVRLELVRAETEREVFLCEEEFKKTFNRALETSREHARIKVAELLESAASSAEKMRGISDEMLKEIIRRHIERLLFGEL